MSILERIDLQYLQNPEGSIVVAQSQRNVPFEIQRVYYLFGVPAGQVRGRHAHKALTQVAVCVAGSCTFRLDDGHETAEIRLTSPHQGILIRPRMWREMHDFSPDCVLLVLASAHYDEADYIRDYDEFKRFVARG